MLKKFYKRLEELYEKIEKLQDNILILRREIKELEARIDKQDEFLRSVKGVIKNERKVSDYHKKLEWLRSYPDETRED